MSSPASGISTLASDFVNGIVAVLDQFAVALTNYAPLIADVVIGVGVASAIGYALTRIPFVSKFLGWLGL